MTSDLCPEAAVVHITTPQIITSESLVCVGGGAGASAGVRGPPAAGGSAVELGRRLLLAARAGDTPLVLDLMAKGAPFTTDWLGTSPLHLAAGNAHVETCGVLLRAGVSRDSRTKVERTPLHLAAHAGHAAVAALLLEHGALVDCRDMLRMTPLHWAAERGHAACCGVLLRHGADARALSKFHKTPAQLAAAKGHDHVRALIDDALRQREAARAGRELRALQLDRSADEATEPQRPAVASVQKIQDIKIKAKPVQEKAAKVETKTESAFEQAGAAGGGPGAAAALLRRHGITLLPADDGSTLLNALQSGRTVVLSDAGKLMLKECGSPAAGAASPTSSASARARGVVLTCAPVRAPPPGVRVFALNNRRAPAGTPAPATTPAAPAVTAPAPRRITLADNQQVKFVQLPADARVVSPRKATRVRRVTGSVAAAAGTAAGTRPPVKIIMNKSNFERLVAGARRDSAAPDATPPAAGLAQPEAPAAADGTEEAEPVQVGAEGSDDPAALGAALAAAQRAVARLTGELQQVRARLAHYEPA